MLKRQSAVKVGNYHKWDICNPALEEGIKQKTPLYKFLEEALIRKYGSSWFDRLLKII